MTVPIKMRATGFHQALGLLSLCQLSLSFHTTSLFQRAEHGRRPSVPALQAVAPPRHVRWHPAQNSWELQTAVSKWQSPATGQNVELHAMVHFADQEYFQMFNEPAFNKGKIVLYEMLLDETTLKEEQGGYRHVTSPLRASLADQQIALNYNWKCQADVVDYQQPNWRHADMTRGEFQRAMQEQQMNANAAKPLWQQVSTASAASDVATALFIGPPTMSDKETRRKLLSNPLLPGSNIVQALRLILWIVPTPELSILLLDWASTTSAREVWRASWSPIVRFLLQALSAARLDVIQRLAFGQILLTGSRPSAINHNDAAQSLLILGRNQQALKVFDQTLQENTTDTIALLYGSSHCPDLSQSLLQRGFLPKATDWRTAWTVELEEPAAPVWLTPATWLVPVTLYLAVSGADWLASWNAVIGAPSQDLGEVALVAGAYFVRHVIMYLGISKVVLDWQRPGTVE